MQIWYNALWKIPNKRIQHREYQSQCCSRVNTAIQPQPNNSVLLSTHIQYITASSAVQEGIFAKNYFSLGQFLLFVYYR